MDAYYLTQKEAAVRYGYSVAWFRKQRAFGEGPKFIQLIKSGRVLYPIVETDEWFKIRMRDKE
jgi:hypothetical protein